MNEPSGTTSVKSTLKPLTKSQRQPSKLLGKVKKLLHKKPPKSKNCFEWSGAEVLLCNILAWTGALIVTAVVLRSLYLMYCKPEGT